MNDRVFIIHGWQSQPNEGWLPWLNNELCLRGMIVRTPAMPNTKRPKCHRWVEELEKIVTMPSAHCHFVGHSLGCVAILRYLETLSPGEKVGTVVLVSGFAEDIGIREIDSFYAEPFDFDAIRSHALRFVSIHSDRDTYITQECFQRLKKNIGAEDVCVLGGGHFSMHEGFFQLPEALQALFPQHKKSPDYRGK